MNSRHDYDNKNNDNRYRHSIMKGDSDVDFTNIWCSYIEQSRSNTEIANQLYQQCKYGPAAFFAQQSIELAIKAYAIRFGLASVEEISVHLPSQILLPQIYEMAQSEIKKIQNQRLSGILEEISQDSLKQVMKTSKVLIKMEKKKSFRNDCFRMSLGLGVHKNSGFASALQQFADSASRNSINSNNNNSMASMLKSLAFDNDIPKLLSSFTILAQQSIAIIHKTRQTHRIQAVRSEFEHYLKANSIPARLSEIIFDYRKYSDKSEIEKFFDSEFENIKDFDYDDMVEVFVGKDGVLDKISKIKEAKHSGKLLTLVSIITVSDAVIFSYPHFLYGSILH